MGMICTLRGSISFGKAVNYKYKKHFIFVQDKRNVKLLDLNEKSKIYDSKVIVFSQKSWKDVLVYQNKWINHDPLQ